MLHIPPGMSNTYTYDIPRNMPQGLYWYHCHLHGLTAAQVYTGLVGLLAIGRTDGNLPLVTDKRIPIRNMALQYNFVFDRAGRSGTTQQPELAAVGEHDNPAEGRRAGERHLPSVCSRRSTSTIPSREPSTSRFGTRARFQSTIIAGSSQFIPSNLQQFTASDPKSGSDVPANPSLPDYPT